MRIEVMVTDEQDRDELYHLLHCEEHRPEFVDQLLNLFNRALTVPPPATVTMIITPIVGDAPCE